MVAVFGNVTGVLVRENLGVVVIVCKSIGVLAWEDLAVARIVGSDRGVLVVSWKFVSLPEKVSGLFSSQVSWREPQISPRLFSAGLCKSG